MLSDGTITKCSHGVKYVQSSHMLRHHNMKIHICHESCKIVFIPGFMQDLHFESNRIQRWLMFLKKISVYCVHNACGIHKNLGTLQWLILEWTFLDIFITKMVFWLCLRNIYNPRMLMHWTLAITRLDKAQIRL